MRPLLPVLSALLLLTACGNLQNLAAKSRAKRQQKAMEKLAATSSDEAASRLGATALGEIAYVDDAEQFVLIRTLTGVNLPGQAGLESRSQGKRTALLRATAERKNGFIAADLLEGTPQTGDTVVASTEKPKLPPLRPATAPSTASPETALLPPPAIPGSGTAPVPMINGVPALPSGTTPSPAELGFDPANLPPLKDAIVTPEDLKK